MSLHYQLIDRKAPQTLLLVHGFLGSRHDWDYLADRLDLPLNLLVIDLPGHGASLSWHTHDFEAKAFFVQLNRLLQHLKLEQLHLLGYSMGGRLVLQWALQFSHGVRSLILESAHPGIQDLKQRQARLQQDVALSQKIATSDFESFLKQWYRQPLFANLTKHPNFNALLRRRLKNDRQQVALALRGFSVGRQPSLWERLSGIEFPVLLIYGQLDEKYAAITKKMCALNARFQKAMAPDCGHTVHFENPDWFVTTVRAFLQKQL